MAKESASQRHKRYLKLFEMEGNDKHVPAIGFEELVAAIQNSFIAERFDDTTLVIVPREENETRSYSTKMLWRKGVSGKGNPEYEEFRITLRQPTSYVPIFVDMQDGDKLDTDIIVYSIPRLISGLMTLFEEFDEVQRNIVLQQEQCSKPRIQDYLPDGVPALLERLFADSGLQYDFNVYAYKSIPKLWIRLPYKRLAYFQIPLDATEGDINVAIDAAKDLKALMTKYKGKIEISGRHYNYLRWKGKPDENKKNRTLISEPAK